MPPCITLSLHLLILLRQLLIIIQILTLHAFDKFLNNCCIGLYSRKLLYTVFSQSFDDLVAKKLPKENMKIKDKDGSDMGESVGPDYVVCIEYKRSHRYY